MIPLKLLISNNPQTIAEIRKIEKCDVALSVESAVARAKQKKYDCIITDGFNVIDMFNNVITVKQYLASMSKSKQTKVRKQEVIAVFSVKGGTGKTTFVKELAENIAEDISVLIIDLNFQDGGSDLSYMLKLPILPHIGTYLKEKEHNHETLLKNLCQYKPNVYVLQAPPKVNLVNNIKPENIEEILKLARTKFEIIIFDLPNELNDIVKTAINNATKKVVVSTGLISEAKRISELEWKDIIVGITAKGWRWRTYFKDYLHFNIKDPEQLFNVHPTR